MKNTKKDGEPVHLSYELSRNDFEQMIEDDLQRTMAAVSKALDDARLFAVAAMLNKDHELALALWRHEQRR